MVIYFLEKKSETRSFRFLFPRAKNGTRTRDPDLGKVALYSRLGREAIFAMRCKDTVFSIIYKYFIEKNDNLYIRFYKNNK